jgi:hypothetical protein
MAVVAGAAAVGPLWTVYPTGPLAAVTLGRVMLLASIPAAGILLLGRRPRGLPPVPLVAFLGGLGALWIVMTASASTRGCYCAGSWYGYTELATLAALIAVCVSVVPELRTPLLGAALVGTTVAAVLGLLSIVDIHQSTVPIMPFAGRIGGPFGNPNFLGFAIATGVPIAVAGVGRGTLPQRLVALACLAPMVIALAETYSRGAILAAVVGTLVIAALLPERRRTQVLVLTAGVALTVVVALATYSRFDQARTTADFTAINRLQAVRDRNGWDGAARGLIRNGPSSLSNPAPGVLMARTGGANRGLSFDLGAVGAGQRRSVSFDVESSVGLMAIAYGIEDDKAGMAVGLRVVAAPTWRRVAVQWRPLHVAPTARLYIWQTGAGPNLRIRRVEVSGPNGVERPDLTLRGPGSPVSPGQAATLERHYVASRISVLRWAFDAFRSSPIVGIGWERFASYAKARDPSGALATHDEYVRIAAELGILGLAPLLVALAGVAAGIQALVKRREGLAVVGGSVTAGVGLLFVNGLVTPAASGAVAVVAALAAAALPWSTKAPPPPPARAP